MTLSVSHLKCLSLLETGTHGPTIKVLQKQFEKTMVLKKIEVRKTVLYTKIAKEMVILYTLRLHPNIVHLVDIFSIKQNIYLLFEFVESDLETVLKAGILKKIHKKYIIYQILKALTYIHSANITHRNLKLQKILLSSECHVRIAGFSQAEYMYSPSPSPVPLQQKNISDLWYRPLELIIGGNVGVFPAQDIWSVGCIFAELINAAPLFPGNSVMNMLHLFVSFFNKPTPEDIAECLADNIDLNTVLVFPHPHTGNIDTLSIAPNALDFIKKTICLNPKKRITAAEALDHVYFRKFFDRDDMKFVPPSLPIDLYSRVSRDSNSSDPVSEVISECREEMLQNLLWEQIRHLVLLKNLYDQGRAHFKQKYVQYLPPHGGSAIQNIELNIFLTIFRKLSRRTIFQCRLVCKSWYEKVTAFYETNQLKKPTFYDWPILHKSPENDRPLLTELPEIFQMVIFQHFSPKTLATCCLVCKLWHVQIWMGFYNYQLSRPKSFVEKKSKFNPMNYWIFQLPQGIFTLIMRKIKPVPYLCPQMEINTDNIQI